MAVYSDINGFPESGFPVLSDVSDRVCLNTLYWNPLKEAGFILDVVGNNRLAGNLSLAGMLSGVTSITMNGALSGVSTITANGTATLTSSNPLSLTDVNANIRMPGLNSSIGSILERVYKGYFKNLDVANTLTVNGNDVALIGDIKRYVSGTLNTLPKYNATGITDSKFTDDGTTPKYNGNTIWHSGNDGAGSTLDADTIDGIESARIIYGQNNIGYNNLSTLDCDNVAKAGFYTLYATAHAPFIGDGGLINIPSWAGDNGTDRHNFQLAAELGVDNYYARSTNAAGTGLWAKLYHDKNINLSTVDFLAKDLTVTTAKIGSLSGYLKATLGVVGAVSSIPESDITPTAYATLAVTSNATTWDCSTGLNKRVTISANLALTITNLVDGMSGDLVVNVSSISTITITTTGFTQKKYGSLTSKPIGKYHLCWICEGTNIDFNITDTPYA